MESHTYPETEISLEEAKEIFLLNKDSIEMALTRFIESEGFAQHSVNDELRGRTFLGSRKALESSFDALVLLSETGQAPAHKGPVSSVLSAPSILDLIFEATGGEVDELLLNTLLSEYLDFYEEA